MMVVVERAIFILPTAVTISIFSYITVVVSMGLMP
jgi:hypothetical protein